MSNPALTPHAPLDPARIAAGAGAIAANVALLLLLLAPLSPPVAPPPAETTVVPIIPVPPRIVTPPPVVPVRPPRTPQPVATPARPEVPPVDMVPVVEPLPGDLPADPPLPPLAGDPAPTLDPAPASGAALAYRHAPPPPYPVQALREGLRGTVVLRVTVDVDGTPMDVAVERSSGHRVLDTAARRHVLARWRFEPAVRDGVAVRAVGLVPIEFNLER
ncbi:MAG TPA: energy transducer TonB [Lysobacter sp.]|nr:energy transducer TonB [Lysobacter sp.]